VTGYRFKCLLCRRIWASPLWEVRCHECGSGHVMRLPSRDKQPPTEGNLP
jgi:DNA-directed RNA polymerase subunit RPC12/RpoP